MGNGQFKLLLILAVILFLIQVANAQQELSCQYKTTKLSEKAYSILYDNEGNRFDDPISIQGFISGMTNETDCICQTSFDVKSSIDKNIRVKIDYDVVLKSEVNSTTKSESTKENLQPAPSRASAKTIYDGGELCKGTCEIVEDSIKYEFLDNGETHGEWKRINETVCLECNGHICFNDGDACSSSIDCGSKHCVEGYCSNSTTCYNDNCHCDEKDKLQCPSNDSCVRIKYLDIGSTPVCRVEECNTTFVNESTGKCVVLPQPPPPPPIKEIILTLFAFLVIGTLFYWNKRKSAEKDIEKLKAVDKNLRKKKRELKELEQTDAKSDKIKERIKGKTDEIENLVKVYEERYEKIVKPRKSHILKGDYWVWSNPKFEYYPCYVEKDEDGNPTIKRDKLVHKDVAERHIFQKYPEFFEKYYSGLSFNDLQVHHIDRDTNNYEVKNLIILTKEQHNSINNDNIKIGDRDSGIKELRRLGFKSPHLRNELEQQSL